jgi:hypothetical protein
MRSFGKRVKLGVSMIAVAFLLALGLLLALARYRQSADRQDTSGIHAMGQLEFIGSYRGDRSLVGRVVQREDIAPVSDLYYHNGLFGYTIESVPVTASTPEVPKPPAELAGPVAEAEQMQLDTNARVAGGQLAAAVYGSQVEPPKPVVFVVRHGSHTASPIVRQLLDKAVMRYAALLIYADGAGLLACVQTQPWSPSGCRGLTFLAEAPAWQPETVIDLEMDPINTFGIVGQSITGDTVYVIEPGAQDEQILWVVDTAAKSVRRLPLQGALAVCGGGFVPSPDGRFLATTGPVFPVGYLPETRLCVIDLADGTEHVVTSHEQEGYADWVIGWSASVPKRLYFGDAVSEEIWRLDLQLE